VDVSDPKSDAENGIPIARLVVRNRAMATSGDYRRGVEIGGRHYSHIVNPRTCVPADRIISSTVVASIPTDALATALSVLTVAESVCLVATVPGAEYLSVKKDGEKITSAGWSSLETPSSSQSATEQPTTFFQTVAVRFGNPTWNDKYELVISVELSLIQGYRVRQPCLVVWIEDEKCSPVRTIPVRYQKEKFLLELYSWSRAENMRSISQGRQILNSVSSATRPPCKYTFRWDGKNDFGQLVKSGKYNVIIEAAREHGTDHVIRQEIDFNGSPQHFQFPGGVEIASSSLDYHKIVQ
jgi:thiamine biosynthesis lipoprotein